MPGLTTARMMTTDLVFSRREVPLTAQRVVP